MKYHVTNTDNPVDFPKSALKHTKGNLLVGNLELTPIDIVASGANKMTTGV